MMNETPTRDPMNVVITYHHEPLPELGRGRWGRMGPSDLDALEPSRMIGPVDALITWCDRHPGLCGVLTGVLIWLCLEALFRAI